MGIDEVHILDKDIAKYSFFFFSKYYIK